jgi:hypothetical protein
VNAEQLAVKLKTITPTAVVLRQVESAQFNVYALTAKIPIMRG